MTADVFPGQWPPASGNFLPLAVPFVSPAFFWAGLIAVGIPVLIHILNRRRFKVVAWAAMEYLLQAMRKNRRRLKFEQWILLAVRCLVLLFLGLALARPLACDNSSIAAFAGKRTGMHIFVLDNSYSMAYERGGAPPDFTRMLPLGTVLAPGGWTHLMQAKWQAAQVFDKLVAGGESVVIITAGKPATAVIAKPTLDLNAATQALVRIEQGYTGNDLAGALELALKIARDEPRQPNKHLYIFSDNTRAAWEGAQATAIAAAGRQLPEVFHNKITVYNLGQEDQWNRAALDVRPASNLLTTRFNPDFIANLKGYGPAGDVGVVWKIDGREQPGAGPNVKLAPDSAPIDYSGRTRIDKGGPHVISVTLAGDDHLKQDNTRSRVVDVASELKVLIVEGERGLGALSGSGAFLELALAPPRAPDAQGGSSGPRSDSPIAPELITSWELGGKVLDNYRAVILTDVPTIQPAQADQLQKYVQNGGTLMLFMGPQVNGENYNAVLLGKPDQASTRPDGKSGDGKSGDVKARRLLPGKLIKVVSSDQSTDKKAYTFNFDPQGESHRFLDPFKHVTNSGLDTAQIYSYWQIELSPDSYAEHVLDYLPPDKANGAPTARANNKSGGATASGDPAITVHRVGQGHVVFCSTTANADWTTFPAKPNFVTFVHELVYGSVTAGDRWMNLTCGQPLEVPPNQAVGAPPKLSGPAKKAGVTEEVPLEPVVEADGATAYKSRPLARPGVYSLDLGGGKPAIPIAVNTSAEESDVRTIVPEGVRQSLGDIEVSLETDQMPAEAVRRDQGNDLSWWFMFAVLSLAATECFMAMRFGHYRRK